MVIQAGELIRRRGERLGRTGLAFFAGVVLIATLSLILKGHWWAWLMCVGALVILLLLERRFIEEALPWLRGAKGERKVGEFLKVLERDGYRVLPSLRRGKGDIDHVVVGPTGVFAIDSKAWTARPRVQGDQLLVGRRDETGALKSLIGQAAFVRQNLSRELRRVWVEAVLASAETIPRGGCRKACGVWVLPAEDVAGFIKSRPSKLSAGQIDQIEQSLQKLRT